MPWVSISSKYVNRRSDGHWMYYYAEEGYAKAQIYRTFSGGSIDETSEKRVYPGIQYRARFIGYHNARGEKVDIDLASSPVDGAYSTEKEVNLTKYGLSDHDLVGTLYLEAEVATPSTPSYIYIPSKVKAGDKISISWGSASDAYSYRLYRSINGGGWTLVYYGSSRSYSETVRSSWDNIQYRVQGESEYHGVSGSYKTSRIVKVIHFPSLGLKINGVLKESDMGWVKVNGELKEIDSVYTKINGVLKEVE